MSCYTPSRLFFALLAAACLLLLILPAAAASIPVNGTVVITEPGTYVLQADMTGSGALICIDIQSSDVIFDGNGHTISDVNMGNSTGIQVSNADLSVSNVTIKNVRLSNFYIGIELQKAQNSTIQGVTMTGNKLGIYLNSSSANTVSDNTITVSPIGIYLVGASSGNTVSGNTVSGNRESDQDGFGIVLVSVSEDQVDDNTVNDNTVTGNFYGIFLVSASGNTVSDNTLTGNLYGIFLVSTSGNTFSDNTLTGNFYGIYLAGASGNTVSDNTLTGNNCGIFLASTSANMVSDNTVTGNQLGIYLDSSSANTVSDNNFNNLDNVLFGDAIVSNSNSWNTPIISGTSIIGGPSRGGNFWGTPDGSGYSQTHPDSNNDGFCDDPYALGIGNIDNLPLHILSPVPPAPSLTAGFYAFGHVGQAPYPVRFLDQSAGSATAWHWDFGDGTTSTEQNPTHIFNRTGAYNVALTASNDQASDTSIQYRCIIVNTVPVANFTANATAGRTPFTVQFTDQSTGATGYQWQFGDGTTSTDQNAVHTYTQPGAYTVTLVASAADYGSVFTQKQGYITVTDPPTVGFSANVTAGISPLAVQFNESTTGLVPYFYWQFGDGGTSFDLNPVHIYNAAGRYTVSLYAIDSNGYQVKTAENYINVTALVTPTPTVTATSTVTPVPTATGYSPVANFTVTPQGSPDSMHILVTDTSVNATSVQYDLGDGTTTAYPNFRYTYWQVGTYTIKQTVTNAAGSSTKNVTVTIPVATPTTTSTAIGGDQGWYTIHGNVEGATVLFDQTTKGTIAQGVLKIPVYTTGAPYRTYTVQMDGYTTVSGTITDHPGKDQNVDITVNLTPASGQTQYNGPHTIPGTLQAEDYDLGGEGVAYHDTTSGNAGGIYRQDDVDIEQLDTDRSPNVGWIRAGEWLAYTVNVSTAGTYDAGFRVSSSHAGSSVQVYVDSGTTPIATVNVPNTGDWPAFRTVSVPVTLPAGQHRLVLKFPTDSVNINWIVFAPRG